MGQVRTLLGVQAAAFGLAALIHSGVLLDRYQHREATIAESVIAGILALGTVTGTVRPAWDRTAALAVQAFALLGTCVGIVTMVIGIGPQSRFDVALHAAFVVLLVTGLVRVARRPRVGAA
jgi:hypothetical protein